MFEARTRQGSRFENKDDELARFDDLRVRLRETVKKHGIDVDALSAAHLVPLLAQHGQAPRRC